MTNTQLKVKFTYYYIVLCIYNDLRKILIDKSVRRDTSFITMTDAEKLRSIMTYDERECAKYLVNAMSRRKSLIYNS